MPGTRRRFLLDSGVIAGASILSWVDRSVGQSPNDGGFKTPNPPDGFPRQNPKLVEETVSASHGKFDRVKELVTAYPELAKSSWDAGFGDWEAPIDAASHVGNREIAIFLMDHGARPTIFTFAMLGQVDIVRAMLAAQPALRKSLGPHGFNLFHHAKVGGEAAVAMRDYLVEIGETEYVPANMAKETVDAVLGKYETAGPESARFEVLANKQGLAVKATGGSPRNLRLLPDGSMHPVGAQSVRFTFEVVDGRARSSSVAMGGRVLRAMRVQ